MYYVDILPIAPVDQLYTYTSKEAIEIGQVVSISFGKRTACGVVWRLHENQPTTVKSLIKPIATLASGIILPKITLRFVEWVARYTITPLGSVLKLVISSPYLITEPKKKSLKSSEPTSDLKQLLPHLVPLSSTQRKAADILISSFKECAFSPILLDGITGSGKTEVYFEAIATALDANQQVLILLPEIALNAAWNQRFQERFGQTAAVWHSTITPKQRRITWQGILTGDVRVVVGARSALFLPFKKLGLIIVDEEHDSSFKQEEGVLYNARDMAIVRAHLGHIPIILASATPSLETIANVTNGRYKHVQLFHRHGPAVLPKVHTIDMRHHKEKKLWISSPLSQAMINAVAAGEQVMLFLNRRGYAPLVLCRTCGYRLMCPHCTVWLNEHRSSHQLMCHHCGYKVVTPSECPSCQQNDAFTACGPGVERIAEEVKTLYPNLRLAVLSSDTVQNLSFISQIIEQIHRREIDVIVGTQMIAKGHHFPHLTIVGVIDADLGLEGGDLRAAERTYQLLQQVAGRAGRAERPGNVYLQTYMPENPLIQALLQNDRDGFLAQEAEERRLSGAPPYGRFVGIILSGSQADQVEKAAHYLARTIPSYQDVEFLGPAPAPLSKIRGKFRWRFLVKSPREIALQKIVQQWIATTSLPSNVRIQIDVDPYNFL